MFGYLDININIANESIWHVCNSCFYCDFRGSHVTEVDLIFACKPLSLLIIDLANPAHSQSCYIKKQAAYRHLNCILKYVWSFFHIKASTDAQNRILFTFHFTFLHRHNKYEKKCFRFVLHASCRRRRDQSSQFRRIILMEKRRSDRKLNWSQMKHFDVDERLIYEERSKLSMLLLHGPICPLCAYVRWLLSNACSWIKFISLIENFAKHGFMFFLKEIKFMSFTLHWTFCFVPIFKQTFGYFCDSYKNF